MIHESQKNEISNSKLVDKMQKTVFYDRNTSFHIKTFDRKEGSLNKRLTEDVNSDSNIHNNRRYDPKKDRLQKINIRLNRHHTSIENRPGEVSSVKNSYQNNPIRVNPTKRRESSEGFTGWSNIVKQLKE